MGLFGNWEKEKYCPNCYNNGYNDGAYWIVDTFHCPKCKWSGSKNELFTKKQIRLKKIQNLMKRNIFLIFMFITYISFGQSRPKDDCVKFILIPNQTDSFPDYCGEIMGFSDCENINDSTCIPIEGKNGVLLHNYDGSSGHIWVYKKDILNLKDFEMPENIKVLATDTSQLIIPPYPLIYDYCGNAYEYTICYTWEMRYDTFPPPAPGVENIGIAWDQKWYLKNDRDFMVPDTIKIKKDYEAGEVAYNFIYYDCLKTKHEWTYTYYFKNKPPSIFTNNKKIIYDSK